MNPMKTYAAALFCVITAAAQSPITTTFCDLTRDPQPFIGKIIRMRAPVSIAFEHFALSASACDSKRVDDIWLEYGRGPKQQPTTWCCGEIANQDPLEVLQNADFRKFHRYLIAQRRSKGCHEGECYLYNVTATLRKI
jgi:hypothetical protein